MKTEEGREKEGRGDRERERGSKKEIKREREEEGVEGCGEKKGEREGGKVKEEEREREGKEGERERRKGLIKWKRTEKVLREISSRVKIERGGEEGF